MEFFIGGWTSTGGSPDKSRKPYWNLVRRVGHVRCPKLDNPVCKIGYSDFDWTDNWNFWRGFGQRRRGDSQRNIDIIHIGLYSLEKNKFWNFFEAWTCRERIDLRYWEKYAENTNIQEIWFFDNISTQLCWERCPSNSYIFGLDWWLVLRKGYSRNLIQE
jgi:hypothetical protein